MIIEDFIETENIALIYSVDRRDTFHNLLVYFNHLALGSVQDGHSLSQLNLISHNDTHKEAELGL